MNILYLGSFRFPNGDAAGARVLNNARALRLAGHSIEFISWGGEEREEDLCEDGIYRYDGFVYQVTHEINLSGSPFHKFLQVIDAGKKTKKILESHIGMYDVIIFYNGNYDFTKYLLNLSKKTGVKIIHDLTEWYAPKEILFFQRRSYERNMKELQHSVPNKICISTYLSHYYSGTNNIVIPPLCDSEEEKWQHRTIPHLPRIIKEFRGVRFIYAGTPARKDLLHNAVNVLNKLAKSGMKIQFLILGSTRESYISRFSKELHDKDLHENILFMGRVNQNDVPAYYQLADFMLLLRESTRKSQAGFPTKFAEAMIAGIPVCANITSDLGMYLKDGQTGIIIPDFTETALETTICQKYYDLEADAIKKMKQQTRKVGRDGFDYHTYIRVFDEFVKNLK